MLSQSLPTLCSVKAKKEEVRTKILSENPLTYDNSELPSNSNISKIVRVKVPSLVFFEGHSSQIIFLILYFKIAKRYTERDVGCALFLNLSRPNPG